MAAGKFSQLTLPTVKRKTHQLVLISPISKIYDLLSKIQDVFPNSYLSYLIHSR